MKAAKAKKSAPPNSSGNRKKIETILKKKTAPAGRYVLRLYVTGTTARSSMAIANVRALCEEYLRGRYDLEVIDLYQQPARAMTEQIIAAPTLVKKLPAPPRRMVGDFSDRHRMILGLDLRQKNEEPSGIQWIKI